MRFLGESVPPAGCRCRASELLLLGPQKRPVPCAAMGQTAAVTCLVGWVRFPGYLEDVHRRCPDFSGSPRTRSYLYITAPDDFSGPLDGDFLGAGARCPSIYASAERGLPAYQQNVGYDTPHKATHMIRKPIYTAPVSTLR